MPKTSQKPTGANLFALVKPYKKLIVALVLLTFVANGLSLTIPKMVSGAIDAYGANTLVFSSLLIKFFAVALGIFIASYLQNVVQTHAAERVAKDLRDKLAASVSRQTYAFIQKVSPSQLLTNLTSDIDAVKLFVSQAIPSLVSSLFLIIGASTLLIIIDWKLALAVLSILPIIAFTFFKTITKVRALFMTVQGIVDRLNKIINESILGSALIRVLNSQHYEYDKFTTANAEAKDAGMKILRLFAGMIPIVMFVANTATLIILVLGGHFVINGTMTLGDLAAFNAYLGILIFPIFVIGFMGTIMARAGASYQRVEEVLVAEAAAPTGTITTPLKGAITINDVTMTYGEKSVLKKVSLQIPAGTKTAIIGPTAAGKTQLLNLLTGLVAPTAGTISYDDQLIDAYDNETLLRQVGFVFQDSIMFNLTLRENIAFNDSVTEADVQKAIQTAELNDFITSLPQGLNTIVSERGTTLSGGQKQRVMLARALALNPKIVLLDDFTARVDAITEQKIVLNVEKNYPGITLLSVTQKIASVENYDQIILLMEGEVLAKGTHKELMDTSPEYVQIFNSQRSTNHYEV